MTAFGWEACGAIGMQPPGTEFDDKARRVLDKIARITARALGLIAGTGLIGLGVWGCIACCLQWYFHGLGYWGTGRLFVLSLISIYIGYIALTGRHVKNET